MCKREINDGLAITVGGEMGAFWQGIGVTPDCVIHVREDVLEEEDGPVLQHGLKGLHKTKLILPSSRSQWPSREALQWRYSRFARAR